jgi:Ca2+-binding EF-hand superfamily protein
MGKEEPGCDHKKRFRDVAVIFEHKEGSRLVESKDIPNIVRAMGFNPSNEQLQALQERIAAVLEENTILIPLESIESVVLTFLVEQKGALVRDSYFTILKAFKALDPTDRGFLEAEQLREALAACAEGLSTEEINSMITTAADNQGRIYYAEYAYRLATDGRDV